MAGTEITGSLPLSKMVEIARKLSVVGTDAALTPTQIGNAVSKINGLEHSASEIDGSINRDKQTMVILGDSITAGNGTDEYNTYSISNAQVAYGNALAGHPFDIIYNAGVGGENSTQILSRIYTDVIEKNPTHCMLLCGMNDLTTSLNTSYDDILISNIKSMYDILNENGIHLFLLTNTTTLHDVNKNKQALKINSWMYSYFYDKPNVEIIDLCSAWIDPSSLNGYPKSINLRDNIHPSNIGGYTGGVVIAKALSKYKSKHLFPISALDSYAINNRSLQLANNPLNLGTSGTLQTATDSGQVADLHYVYSPVGVTTVASKEVRDDGFGEYQVMTVSSNAGGYARFIVKSNYLPKIGDKIYMLAEVEITSSTGLNRLQNYMHMGTPSVAGSFGGYGAGDNKDLNVTSPVKMIYKTKIVEVTTDATSLYARFEPYFTSKGVAVIKIGRVAIIKVI